MKVSFKVRYYRHSNSMLVVRYKEGLPLDDNNTHFHLGSEPFEISNKEFMRNFLFTLKNPLKYFKHPIKYFRDLSIETMKESWNDIEVSYYVYEGYYIVYERTFKITR